jgi:hypothetical protein
MEEQGEKTASGKPKPPDKEVVCRWVSQASMEAG